ncbi:YetF domain-containing protein [Dermacoccus nishinomiyaensis]|uniref:YetF domain-containing protein n=1 Tax=Dermacoccus nishinomiyaensis TaxID=1274 RepID=UPI00093B3EAF|nr:YetF domain-containing protein [Dermacoccus nishinomiyaensis]
MNIWPHIGISASGVVGVVVATVVLYAVFVAILHFWGVRYLAAGSTMSVAVFTVLGALCARAMLGNSPTLCGALVAMATLFVLEFGFGRLHAVMSMRSHRAAGRARAWAVMIDGRARPDALRHIGLTAERLHERLRAGGVRHLDDVALAVLEPRGTLTVVRRGESIDPQLLVGIAGLPPGFGDVDTTGGR